MALHPDCASSNTSHSAESTHITVSYPLSVLDLAPVASGSTTTETLKRSVELARLSENLGYERYWFAEHHGMPNIASSSPEILIAHIAAATQRMRIGSGGIMLPNHVPLRVAETFHTLEALHPGRIDLGIGRAPGTDPVTIQALRSFDAAQFPAHLAEVVGLSEGTLPADHPFHKVGVVPNDVSLPPIWILGSSGASAAFAGRQGLGYAFASHFSPAPAAPAFHAYRESFQPSERFPRPHGILAVSAVCADSDEEANRLATTMDLVWVRLQKGEFGTFPSPEEALAYEYTPQDRAVIQGYRALQVIGNPDSVRMQIDAMVRESGADEVMIVSNLHGHEARLRSYSLIAEAFQVEPVG